MLTGVLQMLIFELEDLLQGILVHAKQSSYGSVPEGGLLCDQRFNRVGELSLNLGYRTPRPIVKRAAGHVKPALQATSRPQNLPYAIPVGPSRSGVPGKECSFKLQHGFIIGCLQLIQLPLVLLADIFRLGS